MDKQELKKMPKSERDLMFRFLHTRTIDWPRPLTEMVKTFPKRALKRLRRHLSEGTTVCCGLGYPAYGDKKG